MTPLAATDLNVGGVAARNFDRYQLKTASFQYDFAVNGGATGAITLTPLGDSRIPDGATVVGGTIEMQTALTSGGSATVKLGVTGNDAVGLGATAYSSAPFNSATAVGACLVVPLKATAAVPCAALATVATAALTAGKFVYHVVYREVA